MDVILHLGAHRCATTSFQHYLTDHTDALQAQGTFVWGPKKLRKGLAHGLFRSTVAGRTRNVARRAEGRIRLAASQLQARGARALLLSDENLLGTPEHAMRLQRLYPAAGERGARLAAAFEGRITRVVLVIRPLDEYWPSLAAMMIARGHPVPTGAHFAALTAARRGWRDVITDLACALPEAEICVAPFEDAAGAPDWLLWQALRAEVPPDNKRYWRNRSFDLAQLRQEVRERRGDLTVLPEGEGRWQPFDARQVAKLREDYLDDIHWLAAGADGLATLTADAQKAQPGLDPMPAATRKGPTHDQGQVAQHR